MAVFDSGFNSLFTSGLSARHHERIKIMKKIIEEFSRKFSSYESAKDSLYVKAVNSGRCKDRLSSSCCEMYADIALVLYLKSDSSSSGFYSALVPPKILTAWSVERTQVWNQALLNSLILFPPRYYSLMKMFTVPGYEGEDFMDPAAFQGFNDLHHGICISNTHKSFGASAIFLPGVARRISQLLHGSYFIAFTSLHEAMIHPAELADPVAMQEVIQMMIYDNEIKPDDLLSVHIFQYDPVTNRIIPVL